MKIATVIQARMGSNRLPGKVLEHVLEKPLLLYMVERVKRIASSSECIIATSHNPLDDKIVELCENESIPYYRGSEDDVLSRVFECVQHFEVDLLIQCTGDCPLIDPDESEKVIQHYLKGNYDYTANNLLRSYPRGMDTQVFSGELLSEIHGLSKKASEREHVSLHIYRHPEKYRLGCVQAPINLRKPHYRLTLDTPEDYQLIKILFEALYPKNPNFSLEDIINYLEIHPELLDINRDIKQKAVHES